MSKKLQIARAESAWDILSDRAAKQLTITYGELAKAMSLQHHRPIRFFLTLIQDHCIKNKLPALSILVVNQTGLPGDGFSQTPLSEFESEKQKVFSYPWRNISNPFLSDRSKANDIGLQGVCDVISRGWQDYKQGKTTNKNHPVHQAVSSFFPLLVENYLSQAEGITFDTLKFEGSTGKGNITRSPWIACLDKRVTKSATTGFYPVYHFSEDMLQLHLCLGLGVQQFIDAYGQNKKMQQKMQNAVDVVRNLFSDRAPSSFRTDIVDLGIHETGALHESYQKGTVFNIRPYDTYNIDVERFRQDLVDMTRFYQTLMLDPLFPSIDALIIHQVPEQQIDTDYLYPSAAEIISQAKNSIDGFDTAEIGRYGERYVLQCEREKLINAGRPDLAELIKPHCDLLDFVGWDITSYTPDGDPIFIEVKATRGNTLLGFNISANEWEKCQLHPEKYQIYRVRNVLSQKPYISVITGLALKVASSELLLKPSSYIISAT